MNLNIISNCIECFSFFLRSDAFYRVFYDLNEKFLNKM